MPTPLFLETTDSTNTVARELALAGAPHGAAVLARQQTAGRGRWGRNWLSPGGAGLYGTIIVRPNLAVEDYAKISLTTGLAVSLALEEICRIQPQLKWPNDIYINGRKCGGILVESSSFQGPAEHYFALIGIGLNVNGDTDSLPPELQKTATTLFLETRQSFDISHLFTAIRQRVLHLLTQLTAEGCTAIFDQWQERDMLDGQWFHWLTSAGVQVYGLGMGVDKNSGAYTICDAEGKYHQAISGDMNLSFSERE